MTSYDICLSVSDSTLLSLIISRSIRVATNGIISLFFMANISLCIYTASSVSIHLLMNVQVVSMSWLLWIVLLWTQGCMYLFELEFCPDIYLGVGLLDYMETLLLVFWGTSILCSTVATPFYLLTNSVGGFTFLKTKGISKLVCQLWSKYL